MNEIRIHCRGGQGGMTAARILANAALSEGKNAQAFPEFGPERRGAPVRSYLRIGASPIRLRTPIANPDIVMVFDPGLLADGRTLAGLRPSGLLVINAPEPPSLVHSAPLRVAWVDATRLAQRRLGTPVPNTVMLGSLCRQSDALTLDAVELAVQEWFKRGRADVNLQAVRDGWEAVKAIEYIPAEERATKSVVPSAYASLDDYPSVALSLPARGVAGYTGSWRVTHPVIDPAGCVRCGRCAVFCPEGVVEQSPKKVPEIDLRYCKGCGICAEECPVHAISLEEEQ
jgi:pyruvate ferredoxin oxidoreductase gamma subunit